jgi:hypothetical protein
MGANKTILVSVLIMAAISVPSADAEPGQRVVKLEEYGIMINITEDFSDTPTITAQCLSPLPREIVWGVLAGHEQLDEIVPAVTVSRLVDTGNGELVLYQEGRAGIWFVKRGYKVTFRVREEPMFSIDFEAIDGDFEIFTVKWRVKPMRSGTLVRHEVQILPKFWAPGWAMRNVAGNMMMETVNAIIRKCFETAGAGGADRSTAAD